MPAGLVEVVTLTSGILVTILIVGAVACWTVDECRRAPLRPSPEETDPGRPDPRASPRNDRS